MPPPAPQPGLYLQIYRASLRGPRTTALRAATVRARDVRARGVVLHGFPRELAAAWDDEAAIVRDAGLLALASWGEDLTRDNDGTRLTADEKGSLAGSVLARPTCAGGLIDAEGAWDVTTDAGDDTSERGALALGGALRAEAPDAWVGDQPWFAIMSHAAARRMPRGLGDGGPFGGFPVDEFASFLNFGRFRQLYANDFKRQWGAARYPKVRAWMERDWSVADRVLAAAGLARPLYVTLQGYGWDDVPHHLAHALLTYQVQLQQPVVMYCEPTPKLATVAVIRGVNALVSRGFAGSGVDPRYAVRAFQLDANDHGAKLAVDGWLGVASLRWMGLTF